MFDPRVTKHEVIELLESMNEEDFARFLYCQHMAATFLAVSKFEDSLVRAMQLCDRVKIKNALRDDLSLWDQALLKQEILRGSTLGLLINMLESHKVDSKDVGYLRWLKDKRDYFVHRLFHKGEWPGDLDIEDCRRMSRSLLAIQKWLNRGERQIWLIFERADFVELTHFDDGSILAMNLGVYDLLRQH
jgi:hypothetical protein